MTKDEILKTYGEVKLKFSHYYKFVFTYTGLAENGDRVTVYDGGLASDIYKKDVLPEQEVTINSLYADFVVISKDGKEIARYDDR